MPQPALGPLGKGVAVDPLPAIEPLVVAPLAEPELPAEPPEPIPLVAPDGPPVPPPDAAPVADAPLAAPVAPPDMPLAIVFPLANPEEEVPLVEPDDTTPLAAPALALPVVAPLLEEFPEAATPDPCTEVVGLEVPQAQTNPARNPQHAIERIVMAFLVGSNERSSNEAPEDNRTGAQRVKANAPRRFRQHFQQQRRYFFAQEPRGIAHPLALRGAGEPSS
jgi:hypothetical protein